MAAASGNASGLSVNRLRVDYLSSPLGTPSRMPRFSWMLSSDQRGTAQSVYRIQVASSAKLLESDPDLWDSGAVASSRCTSVPYEGKPLQSRTRYYWRVHVEDGPRHAVSQVDSFETALLDASDWRASWVRASEVRNGNGYHSQYGDSENDTKWVQIDLGRKTDFRALAFYPARPYNYIHDIPGFGFPLRYRIEVSDEPDFANPRVVADRTDKDQAPENIIPTTVELGNQSARYVRIVVTKLQKPKDTKHLFALAEVELLDARQRNVALGAAVTAKDTIEESGWSTAKLTDGGRVSREPGGISPMMRGEFTIDRPVSRARAYVSARGYYELRINGRRIGDRVLDPAYTNFKKRLYYSVYDVTSDLKQGPNCAAAMLGAGWWPATPEFVMQLEVRYSDGAIATFTTGDRWRWTDGPITENSLYHGEHYDANREQPGWDAPGFDDSKWQAVVATEPADARLTAQTIPPIRIVQTLSPRSVTSPRPGVYVFDFGQNFSGWCRLRASAPAGTQVSIRHAELLYADGTVNSENYRSARGCDRYTFRGDSQEIYEPHFTYHGFRYAQLEGLPSEADVTTLTGCVVHTDLESAGKFECSDELLNRIQEAAAWGERTNFHAVPTDCPQRDERQGWMGDAHASSVAMLYNFDMAPAYAKYLQDMADHQGEDGRVADTVPYVWGSNPGDPMWSIAYPLILWHTYRHTGDIALLEQHYDGIKRYVDLLRAEARDYIIERNNYGDWIATIETPRPLISTCAFHLSARTLADIAGALGKEQDEKTYRALCEDIAGAINAKFYNADTGQYGNGSQGSNALPLYLDIVPRERKKAVLDNIVKDIEARGGHLSTGFVCTPFMMDALTREGRADVAGIVATRRDYPGWGYMIENGATTIWELWELKTGPQMNSHNHPALGWISAWYYSTLAGLSPDGVRPGWERFTVKPHMVADLSSAQAELETVRGRVSSRWERSAESVYLEVTIPANSRARVMVPVVGDGLQEVTEGEKLVWKGGQFVSGVDGIDGARQEGKWIAFDTGSGTYAFTCARSEDAVLIPLSTGTLCIPRDYSADGDQVDLVVHFHGSPDRVRDCLLKSGKSAAMVTVSFDGLSAVYTKPFREDPALFGRIVEEARAKLAEELGLDSVKVRALVVSSFSAGFGAVREILKSPEYADAISDLVLADTLYAGYVKKDGRDVVNPQDMEPFTDFARKSAAANKTFWLTYSQVVPPGYASTRETAEYLLGEVGGRIEPTSVEERPALKLQSGADVGRFHVRGYEGDDGPAHMQHLFSLDIFYRQTSLPSK